MANDVRVVDRGWDKMQSFFKQYSKGKAAAVGIMSSNASADHDGLTNAELGSIMEYGSTDGRIPERSFFRSTLDEQQSRIEQEQSRILKSGLEGKQLEGELLLLGEEVKGKIQDKIRSQPAEWPKLAAATVEKKGGDDRMLIETGQLINSLSAEVRDL